MAVWSCSDFHGNFKAYEVVKNYIGENDIINKNSHYDFPSIGRADAIYKAETEALLYQWNSTKLAYEPLNQGEGQMVQYDTIWGGNASGLTNV